MAMFKCVSKFGFKFAADAASRYKDTWFLSTAKCSRLTHFKVSGGNREQGSRAAGKQYALLCQTYGSHLTAEQLTDSTKCVDISIEGRGLIN